MITYSNTNLNEIVLHKVGNKTADEGIHFSKSPLQTNEDMRDLLSHYFLSPFKSEEHHNLHHKSDLKYNEVFGFVSTVFDNPDNLYEQSVNLAKHLYEQSVHPKVKAGEFYTVYFKDCVVNGETVDAVGLFKSENKEIFLKIYLQGNNYEISDDSGININKLDKGCLIFNTEKENGYLVSVVDNNGKGSEAQYWIDHFLQLRQRNDAYMQTSQVLSLCKNFVTQQLPQEFDVTKADQADLLNKSVKFFKEKDSFDLDEFANEVIAKPQAIERFKQYKSDFEQERDFEISNQFEISEAAVKKQARTLKSVIKLDKNFHIYVHGNRELIEQGSDPKGNFYKIYYNEEA